MAKAPLRKPKKKVCEFCKGKATYIDYKDTALLRRYVSDRERSAPVASPVIAASTSATSPSR